jgi:two-component system, LytTR family, response regulator
MDLPQNMRAVIVDDEKPARARMRRLLTECGLSVVGEAGDGGEAITIISKLEPDVAFLDIEMPVLNGLEVAAAFQGRMKIVFATAYDQHAVAAFEQHAVDYLLKPIEKKRLASCIRRLQTEVSTVAQQNAHSVPQKNIFSAMSENITKLGVRLGKKVLALTLSDISLLESSGEYTEIIVKDQRYLIDDALSQLELRLPAKTFLRIHRKAIINMGYLRELQRVGDRKYIARLSDYFESQSPISREALKLVKSKLGMK